MVIHVAEKNHSTLTQSIQAAIAPENSTHDLFLIPSLLYANEVNLLFYSTKLRLTGNFEIEIKIYIPSRFLEHDMEIKDHRNKDKWLVYCLS